MTSGAQNIWLRKTGFSINQKVKKISNSQATNFEEVIIQNIKKTKWKLEIFCRNCGLFHFIHFQEFIIFTLFVIMDTSSNSTKPKYLNHQEV